MSPQMGISQALVEILLLFFCETDILSNCLLNSQLYTNRLVQLSSFTQKACFSNEQPLIERQLVRVQRMSDCGVFNPKGDICTILTTLMACGILWMKGQKYCKSQIGEGYCEAVSSRNDRVITFMNSSQHLAQDQASQNFSIDERGVHEVSPLLRRFHG